MIRDNGIALSIIIVNWNTRDLLAQCLESVFAHPPRGEFDVWVVDNASSDGSAQMVRERFHQVRLIENAQNVGFARANNLALRQCTGRYVLLLNPDTELKPGALQSLVEFMDSHPIAGAAGPLLLHADGKLQQGSCYPAPSLPGESCRLFRLDGIVNYGSYDQVQWDRSQYREVDGVSGACIILRSDALGQVGLLDECYFMYSEEVDLCYRLRQHGWQVFWDPAAQVIHYGGQSTRQVEEAMFLALYRSKVLYFRKHFGSSYAAAYKLILLVVSVVRMSAVVAIPFLSGARRKALRSLVSHYGRLLRSLAAL